MKYYFIISFLLLIGCVKENPTNSECLKITASAKSHSEATKAVESAEFRFVDSVDTSESSWIRSAKYYSCDGEVGYFIYATDKKKYIHQNVPVEVWNSFKGAKSFGKFYHKKIKNKYKLTLNDD